LSGCREPGYPLDDALCATVPKSPRLTALNAVDRLLIAEIP